MTKSLIQLNMSHEQHLGHKNVYFGAAQTHNFTSMDDAMDLIKSQLVRGFVAKVDTLIDRVDGSVSFVVYFGA